MEKREKSEIKSQSDAFVNIWNSRPDLRGRIFAINNNSENAIKGAFNKAMGVLPGVSDMAFVCEGGHIVWIEWKTSTGSQSKQQIEWQRQVTALGHTYIVVRSEDEFLQVIARYESKRDVYA